jgi:hypothetical protein
MPKLILKPPIIPIKMGLTGNNVADKMAGVRSLRVRWPLVGSLSFMVMNKTNLSQDKRKENIFQN